MKALKILAMVCFILGFTAKINAQSISTRDIGVPFSFYIDCIDEIATGTITLHTVVHFDNEGNWTSFHYQPQGGVLIGESSGTVYHAVGVNQSHWKSFTSNGSWTQTSINNFIAVGVGKDAVNWGGKATYHATVAKDGNIIVEFDKFETFCK